jgi:SH3-like domain-containing protein
MKIQSCLGLGLAIALMWGSSADARGQGAGMGYSSADDTTYCSTTLQANDSQSRINLREGPGTNYAIRHYGRAGDWVDFLSSNGDPNEWLREQDKNGSTWYQVGFPKSRAYGWVRADFVQLPPVECRN